MATKNEPAVGEQRNLSVVWAYVGVILIWSTTPLAIVWSDHAAGFVFAVSSRMVLGFLLAMLMLFLLRKKMAWHRSARLAYLYGGLGIYVSMMLVYWGAQFVPSGWIALLFGLSPVFSAVMAMFWLEGEPMSRQRLWGIAIGFAGLWLIFWRSLSLHPVAVWAMVVVLLAAMVQSAAAVWVKRVNAKIPAITMTAGSLAVAAPLFLLTWLWQQGLSDTAWWSVWDQAPVYALVAIGYLALFGSVFGFVLYFYLLQHVDATKVALITLMTPVSALLLGHHLNSEPLGLNTIMGALLVLSGLGVFQFGQRLKRPLRWGRLGM